LQFSRPVPLEHGLARLIDLHMAQAFHPGLLEAEIEPAYASEEREKGERLHINRY
jgi:hypothetical protein